MVPTSCRRPGSHREEENRESAYRKYRLDTFVRLFMVQFTSNERPDMSMHPIGDGQLHRRYVSVSQ